jgi:hypothetical protein
LDPLPGRQGVPFFLHIKCRNMIKSVRIQGRKINPEKQGKKNKKEVDR